MVDVRAVAATLDPSEGSFDDRQASFEELREHFSQGDAVRQQMAKVMKSFAGGLFAGEETLATVQDNLELERWFRHPKGHERRIHGHRHAGVRIVREGPTMLLALDAHLHHPEPFGVEDLFPYRHAQLPGCQLAASARHAIMRKARSKKKRALLFKELEARYNDST